MCGKSLLLKPTWGSLKSMLGNEPYSTVEIPAEHPSPPSSIASSWVRSKRRSTETPSCRTCCWTASSARLCRTVRYEEVSKHTFVRPRWTHTRGNKVFPLLIWPLLMKWACFPVSVQASWRRTVSTGVQHGIPMPCFTTALSFYDGYRHEKLPANLLQVRQQEALPPNTARAPQNVKYLLFLTHESVVALCFRHKGTTLERTRTSCCQTLESSSTPTGQATEETSRPPPTTHEDHATTMSFTKSEEPRDDPSNTVINISATHLSYLN